MRHWIPELVALPVLPFLIWQGRRTRRLTPRLPEAGGPTAGVAPGIATGRPLRLLAVGESPVAGVGVHTHDQAITGQLAAALAATLGRPVHWRACGRNGVTVREALEVIMPAVPAEPVDILFVAFGVNDTTAFRRPPQWRADMTTLLAALRARCQPALLLVSGVPPVGRFPALPQPLRAVMGLKATSLDAVLRELVAAQDGLLYVPLNLDPARRELMAHDGYHPSAAGCSTWAAKLARIGADRLAEHGA